MEAEAQKGPAAGGGARATAQITVAAVAVAAALVLGFLAGASSQPAPVLDRMPPPASTPPIPVVFLGGAIILPAAHADASTAVSYNGYWTQSLVGGNLSYTWSSPVPIDACVNPSPGYAVAYLDCTVLSGSTLWVNQTSGKGNFTVPSQPDDFNFYALSPRGIATTVTGSFSIKTSSGSTPPDPFSDAIPTGALAPPYVYANLSAPFPAGYDALTIQGNASHLVLISFDVYLCCSGIEWNHLRTSWNVTAYYSAPDVLNVTLEATYPEPTNVSIAAIAFTM